MKNLRKVLCMLALVVVALVISAYAAPEAQARIVDYPMINVTAVENEFVFTRIVDAHEFVSNASAHHTSI